MRTRYAWVFASVLVFGWISSVREVYAGEGKISGKSTSISTVNDSLLALVGQELLRSLDGMGSLATRPKTLLGVPYEEGFAWSGLAVTLAEYRHASGQERLGKHDLLRWNKDLILATAAKGETFDQLFCAKTLYLYQPEKGGLAANPLWKAFSPAEQEQVRALFDLSRSVDLKTLEPTKGRPVNYLAVSLLTGAYMYQLGLPVPEKELRTMLEICLKTVESSNGYLDDDKNGRGRYDRYAFEFSRFVWEAATLLKDKKAQTRLSPWIKKTSLAWWDMYSLSRGHAAHYGRSLQNAWDDAWEMLGFWAENPALAPASLPNLASAFVLSWNKYLMLQFNPQTHLNRMLEPGRGTYSYAGTGRIWGYTLHSFGKAAGAWEQVRQAAQKAQLNTLATRPTLPDVSRLEYFRQKPGENMGIWIVRRDSNSFVVPIVGAFGKPGSSDYAPAPYGFAGTEHVVQGTVAHLNPFIELLQGSVLAAGGGADQLTLRNDTLTVRYNTLRTLEGAAMETGLSLVLRFILQANGSLTLEHSLYSQEVYTVKNIRISLPLAYENFGFDIAKFHNSTGDALLIDTPTLLFRLSMRATTHNPVNRGAFSPIPFWLDWMSGEKVLNPAQEVTFRMNLAKGSL